MRSRAKGIRLAHGVVWVFLVLAVAAYGSVVVRNVTDVLVGMTHQPTMVVVERPNR
jgi:hypothetical protein